MCIKCAYKSLPSEGFILSPIAGPVYKFTREQLSPKAGDAQMKWILMDFIYPVTAVPGEWAVHTGHPWAVYIALRLRTTTGLPGLLDG